MALTNPLRKGTIFGSRGFSLPYCLVTGEEARILPPETRNNSGEDPSGAQVGELSHGGVQGSGWKGVGDSPASEAGAEVGFP